jgi:hypothetical protein
VQQIGKTIDESSYMIGRFNTDTDTDVSAQLFGAEIRNLRQKEVEEKSKGSSIALWNKCLANFNGRY